MQCLEDYVKDKHQQLSSLKDVRKFIKQNSSFFDYHLVRYVINIADTDEGLERLHKYYETLFLDYAKRRIYECPSEFKSTTSCSSDSSQLQVKLDSQ